MPTFTVHAPPPKQGETTSAPERFVFVRDGFHFWAFLLAPLWLLWRRLWLALLGYVVVTFALAFVLAWLGVSAQAQVPASLLIALLVGFEAATLWRWTLTRRGWKTLGFVVGEDREIAEQRFYAAWANRAVVPPAPPADLPQPQYGTPMRRGPPSPTDVIGLFPEPGLKR
ncbi:MAG: DUF2628 domain-containing protein [Rhizobiales bacterium]|nr:DUF2628 domain-containing protein [Hyphomicrobiales bacterium]